MSSLHLSFSSLSLISPTLPTLNAASAAPQPRRFLLLPPIRMGGGPRTFPGGVSKWQWKRMQAKKAKQLLKARLLRERQIYEMRKRAELKAAVSQLEKPWELVQEAPALFSVAADEQVKALADRFQRPGGFDMWSDRDGPQILRRSDGELMRTERFFPKGAVHSVRPYGVDVRVGVDDSVERGGDGVGRRRRRRKGCREVVRGNDDVGESSDFGCVDVEASRVGDENGPSGGVRGNAHEGSGDLGCVDVEASWVSDGNVTNVNLGLENLKGGRDGRRGFQGNENEGRGRGRGGQPSNLGRNRLSLTSELVASDGRQRRGRGRGGGDKGRDGLRPTNQLASAGGRIRGRGGGERWDDGEKGRLRPTSELLASDGGWSMVRDLRRERLGEK